jgi:peptidyl-prolyl cis-trans isomerase B (cyclophilin B)
LSSRRDALVSDQAYVRFFLLLFMALALVMFMACEKEGTSGADPDILLKPIDELTAQDIKKLVAVVKTNYGVFRLRFFPEDAPNTVRSFIKLTREGFYNGLTFHRVVPNYMLVGGCPEGDGTGGPGYTLEVEPSDRNHKRGVVGLLHPPMLPNNGGSQFYIMLRDDFRMDGAYTIFGEVISGMETLDRISDLPNTGDRGKPASFLPLRRVVIENLNFEVR